MTLDKEKFKKLVMLYASENYRRDVIPSHFVILEADEKCKAMEEQVMKVIARTFFRASQNTLK